MSVIDDYLGDLPGPQRRELARIRDIVKRVVPDAEEVLAYRMPTLSYAGKYLIHFAAFKRHMSIFPGTIRFTPETPVPASVIEAIVRKRLAEISEGR
jgi:uncharacterized protein YdhG (YjbR/CyaY superfamily)